MALIDTPSNKVLDDQIRTAISQVAQQLNTKAQLGAVAQSFDADAVDGDGDGLVQDGSPFERPAVLSAISKASQRLGQLFAKAGRSKESRAKEYQRRYAGMSAKDIANDAVPDSFEAFIALTYEKLRVNNPNLPALSPDMTPDEVKGVVRALEKHVESDMLWMMKEDKAKQFKELLKTDRNAAFTMAFEGQFDFSPKAVAKNRELLEHVLTTNPQYRKMVEKFGHPPMFKFGPEMNDTHLAEAMFSDSIGMGMGNIKNVRKNRRYQPMNRGLGKWFMQGIMEPEVGHRKTNRWISDNTPEALLIHEYGHYLTDALNLVLSDEDKSNRTKRWQAFRFGAGADWKQTLTDLGHPEWYDKYAIEKLKKSERIEITRIRKDIPGELPHVQTAYGETAPAEAWAEAIAATFSHGGRNKDLVSPGLRELINAALELPEGGDPAENLTPPRLRREIVPDGFASRGSVMAVNNERDLRYGDKTDEYELVAEVLGDLGKDDPVGQMVRKLQNLKDDPEQWDRLEPSMKSTIERSLNIRVANESEAALMTQVLLTDPAFAEMIRRHGIANFYFAQEDMQYQVGDEMIDIRGSLYAGFTPDESDSGRYWPPRVVIDMLGQSSLDNDITVDTPIHFTSDDQIRKARKAMNIPGGVTRTHLSKSHQHVIRHEGGHAIHDRLWERVHRGEIKGTRAQLIRAYGKETWEEFYKELGRPDLWIEYQRATKTANTMGYPGDPKPSPEVPFIDSGYAWSNPHEFFAETFAGYTSSNPAYRTLINDTALEHMQTMLGDADAFTEMPPALLDTPGVDIPEPPPWDGFGSEGEKKIKSYVDLRNSRLDATFSDTTNFSRAEIFTNTTTEQKIDLTVPSAPQEWATMAWDQEFERMGLTFEQVQMIDLSDPFNPVIPDEALKRLSSRDYEYLTRYGQMLSSRQPDLSPETVQTIRGSLRSTLDASPRAREMAERYGLPPITVMSRGEVEWTTIQSELDYQIGQFKRGFEVDEEIKDLFPAYFKFQNSGNRDRSGFMDTPEGARLQKWVEDKGTVAVDGGWDPLTKTITLNPDIIERYNNGTRINHKHVPVAGDHSIGDESVESVLLHEIAHYIEEHRVGVQNSITNRGFRSGEADKLFAEVEKHIKTMYGRTSKSEFMAEIIAAVLSGSPDQEAMLSPEASRLAREVAGLPEKDPVFAGRTRIQNPLSETRVDRFGNWWTRIDGAEWTSVRGMESRNRDGVPDVLETFTEARQRTGLTPMKDVSFEHDGRKFVLRDNGTVFEIDINGRTVATATVIESNDGMPDINTVDVLPGYEGIAPDKDLHEMIVDHARKRYPSARAPMRARKTQVETEGFASIGPEHRDARLIDGTPGTPEYAQAMATEFEASRVSGKKVFFDYNGETREVEVVEVFEKNGLLYMKGNDALRNGEERMFRLDRVSMPKIVENPETKKKEVAKLPGKKPRRPVPIFTGKATEIFEGASSWEEVAERLGKGRFVFFDFETTGIEENPYSVDYIHPGTPTQIGLVEIIDGKVTRRWSTHVNPGRPLSIDPKTGRSWSADNLKYKDPVTGELKPISNEWLAEQMPLDQALKEMLEFIGPIEDTILGGQNHPYDDDVMKRAMADAGLDPAKWNPGGFIDSQALAQSLLDKDSDDYPRDPEKGYKTVSLGPLATWLGHDMGDGWHSADADSEASYQAFIRLVKRAADHENSGKPVRRDLFDRGGGDKELAERIASFEKEKSGFDYKVKKYQEAKAAEDAALPGQTEQGFASRGASRMREAIKNRRRAKDPARWENLTQEQRDAATKESAEAAIDYLNALQDAGIDVAALRDLPREELDAVLKDLVPGGEARVSEYVTGDGKALIEVSNATMGKVFMSLGLHVQVISDDPNEQHLLESGLNDMQKALQNYVAAVAKDPDALLKDVIFMDWAGRQGINLGTLSGKKLEKAAKKFADKFEINLCLYYKAGTNMLCGANIGIEREEMPQLGGRMKGDDTLAAKAIKTGLMRAKEIAIDKDKLDELKTRNPELYEQIVGFLDPKDWKDGKAAIKSRKQLEAVQQLIKDKDPMVKELFAVMNWNDTEANVEPIADRAAAALGIAIDKPRFVDPATMLGAQNQLQGSKVENMADGAVKAVLEALPVLEARLGRKPTNREISDYLANEVEHGLFQPTLTAGLPGGQIYMLDGHHRWSGLLMANEKLKAMGLDVRVELNIKNYETDIRSGLELGRVIQVAMGVKDAKLAGEDAYVLDPNVPELGEADFDQAIGEIVDVDKLKGRIREVREGGKFRETEEFDVPGGQEARLAPQKRPIRDVVEEITGKNITLDPQSRVEGVKPARKGYRAASGGSGWQSVEDHIKVETERGNELFETYQEYLDKGYEVSWVTHSPGEAGRYVVDAGDVAAWQSGEIKVKPEDISEINMAGATLVGTDGEGGFLYARQKQSTAIKRRIEMLENEENYLDAAAIPQQQESGFASTGETNVPLDLVAGVAGLKSTERGGKAQRDREIVPDDWDTRQPTMIAGVRVPDMSLDEFGARLPGEPIYRDTVRLDGKKYTIEVDSNGVVSVYTGRKYNQVAQLNLDRGHSMLSGSREANPGRHYIDYVEVNKKHRRKGLATEMARAAEAAYGGQVEHSTALSDAGRAWREADVKNRGAAAIPLREGAPTIDSVFDTDSGFASRGSKFPDVPVDMSRWDDNDDGTPLGSSVPKKKRKPGEGAFGFGTSAPSDPDEDWLSEPTDWLAEPRDYESSDGFASRGNYQPFPDQNEDESALDTLADKLNLDEVEQDDFDEIEAMASRITARIIGGDATLAERLGITPEQLKLRWREIAREINEFGDRFVQDSDVRRNVKLGYKILSTAALVFGMKGAKELLATVNPSADGAGLGAEGTSLLDIIDITLNTGLHDALVAYGMEFARLIATEYTAMRLASKEKMQTMIEEIKARIEGTGQKIGVLSTEMWNRLRGAWAKTRPLAPIGMPSGVKEWIVAGSSAQWAEMSWFEYQAKSRITQHLEPTNQAIWADLAVKSGRSPELIDIATYRAGLGYGTPRTKRRDVVRVYF